MFESGHLYGASNRIYYACFYATVALLLTKDLTSSKHSGVVAFLNRHFVKEGIIPVAMGKFYSRVFDNRLESDYGDIVEFEENDIMANLKTAEEFINQIKALLPSI
jgi:uncharacterized protein (UPF0332 family)